MGSVRESGVWEEESFQLSLPSQGSEVGGQGLPPLNASLKGTKSFQTEGKDQKGRPLALGQLTLAL